ncbi:unnamed protein product [Auanema sp. JU1783]|nr:unnamed protein product [Auanema sp. JU1783]
MLLRLSTICVLFSFFVSCLFASPFRYQNDVPVFYKRIPHRYPSDAYYQVSVPLMWRIRRSQPILDYTDEFSADPFELDETDSSS